MAKINNNIESKIISDACEAIIGAIFLEHGINVAEKILTQEKSVAVVDNKNEIIGSINPTKIINTVFGGRKNNN